MSDKQYPHICEYNLCPGIERVFNTFSGFMLIYVSEGTGIFCLNGQSSEFVPGTAVLMSCLDYLRTEVSSGTAKITILELSEQAFSGRVPEFFSIRSLPLLTVFENRQKPETILELIASSIGNDLKNNDIFLRNLSKELVIYTVKSSNSNERPRSYDIKTELAVLYIYSHFRESLSIEAAAAHVHYSVNYFYHSFQNHTGTTFRSFLHNLRLDYAMNLIRFTDLTISDICYECGYNSVQYFSTAFRKRFGKSPKNFINDTIRGETK